MVQFPVTLEMGHVVKPVIAWVVSFVCIAISCSLIYTSSNTFLLIKLSTLYPDARGVICLINNLNKVCTCENGYSYGGRAELGDCCGVDTDCASGNCEQTGPGAKDYFCAPSASGKSGKAKSEKA